MVTPWARASWRNCTIYSILHVCLCMHYFRAYRKFAHRTHQSNSHPSFCVLCHPILASQISHTKCILEKKTESLVSHVLMTLSKGIQQTFRKCECIRTYIPHSLCVRIRLPWKKDSPQSWREEIHLTWNMQTQRNRSIVSIQGWWKCHIVVGQ